MAASTSPREASRKDGDLVAYQMGIGKINKGTLVVLRADGYAYALAVPSSGRAGDIFIGVAFETVDNTAGTAGALLIRVYKGGTYVFPKASAVITDLGQAFYGADDQDVSATTTNAILVGYAVDLIDGANLRIRIDNAVH